MTGSPRHADVLVIGSGFGGSVVASRLIEAGRSVILLERGPWRDTLPVRTAGIEPRKPLPRDGGMLYVLRSLRLPFGPKHGITLNKYGFMEIWIGAGMKVPVTSNVGGGSHVWAALVDRPRLGYWDNRADGLSEAVLAPHFERTSAELQALHPVDPRTVPNNTEHAWDRADFFTPLAAGEQPPMGILYPEAAGPTNATRAPIDYDQPQGMFGSPGASKSTVDTLYLIPALAQGLNVRPMHEARRIDRIEGGYALSVHDHALGRDATLRAPRVVVCAGTMNTNGLMRQCVDAGGLGEMPALGMGIGANGDLIGAWPAPRDGSRNAARGTPIHGRIKIRDHHDGLYAIIGGSEAPPVPGCLRKWARAKANGEYQIIVMSPDASDGRFWSENGRQKFAFSAANSPSYAKIFEAFDALSEMSGRKVRYPRATIMTGHPLGGCRIADDPARGIVNGKGEVHGHPGLYIADGSVFPQSPGEPLTLSIAAWASHVAQNILQNS